MKRKLLFLVAFFLGLATVSNSQNIKYEYDDAGNRKTRLQVSTLSIVEQDYQEEAPHDEELLPQNNNNVYSNPVDTELIISLTNRTSLGYGKTMLYNLQGSRILQQGMFFEQTNLQLGHFISGSYLMKLALGSKSSFAKIIKK